jgi:hypothetical protein
VVDLLVGNPLYAGHVRAPSKRFNYVPGKRLQEVNYQ